MVCSIELPGPVGPRKGCHLESFFFLRLTDLQIWHNCMFFPLAVVLRQFTDTQLAYFDYRDDEVYEDDDKMSLEQQKKRIDDGLGWKSKE
jgi:hypothetical protein